MITQNIHVRMDAYEIPPVIHAVEGDTWRYLDIYTDDAAINTSNTAAVAIHRPDNSYYTISATPDVGGFYHLEMDQALTRPGKVECQLKVSSGDLVMSTYTFYVIVEPSTTGLPTDQLGYDIYDLMDAAGQIHGQPTAITTAAQMTDHAVIYLYMGSESGYSNGHIYYWNGSAFADGGAYGGSGGGGGSVTVDSTMSSTSENPVQNKVIYNALQSKANSSDIPTVVSTITAGNTNPVNSVAVIAYINSLDATNTAY